MSKLLALLLFCLVVLSSHAQVSSVYSISFENAVHHEAEIKATFKNLQAQQVEFRMSRSSPGRYALHEFAKNVYGLKVTDGQGKLLSATRPDPYSWRVDGHDGTIIVSYTLFANRGDGTYSQIDKTHAHLNMPATFMYVPELAEQGIEVTFIVREDLNWKIASQLPRKEKNTYYAPDLQYFMDSPTEISDHSIRSFEIDGQTVRFVLHHNGSEEEFDQYFESVKKIVHQEKAVMGELPEFDYGVYTFLGCYIPQVSGDGMEHRNSTILTSTRVLSEDGQQRNIGTVAHEFFHAWNVERIRPRSLEPFDFERANMSGALWFAEGFTDYYTDLFLCRAGLISESEYIKALQGTFNYVWTYPGRKFFNPIEMSYRAPFVDAATSIDETNIINTFISYYSYGGMLGLALDLTLRQQNLNLDDYMKMVWETFGVNEKAYTIEDLQKTLNDYTNNDLGDTFFTRYIYNSGMPDYKALFKNVGVVLNEADQQVWFGAALSGQIITSYPLIGSPSYQAGLTKGDKVIQFDDILVTDATQINEILMKYQPGDRVSLVFQRFAQQHETVVTLTRSPQYELALFEAKQREVSPETAAERARWLGGK